MPPLQLFLLSLPGLYFNSVLLVWFFVQFSEHGLIFSIARSFSVLKPLLRCMLYGIVPGLIVSNVIVFFGTNSILLISIPGMVGAAISAWLLHKEILGNVQNKKTGNIAIAVVFLAMAALVLWAILQTEPIH
ncbi:hypothetical protein [Ruegeria atlantica]|uniref:hypothetical protein n=1 Tax=Ruegeria atlantica TaxID=81569 RepID=UPI00147FED23|nr:hypothetical protein [Ruegeria atlantica]